MDKNKSDKSGNNRYFWSEMSVNDCGKCDKCEPKCKKGKKCDKPYKYDNCDDIIKYICRLLEEQKESLKNTEKILKLLTNGLAEIKTEIIQILDTLANGEDFTTGAFVLNEDAGSVLVNVLNRTAEEVEVTVTQIIFDSTGAITGTTSQLLVIPPNTTTTVAFPANGSDIDLAQVEIQFQGLVDGVYGWVGARIENENDPLAPSIFVPSNIFTNQDLSPIVIAP